MIRFKALTGDDSEEESRSFVSKKATTKEAQEAEAFALYNQALSLLKSGSEDEAKAVFLRLLSFKLLREAAPLTSEDEGLVHPGLVLKYSVYKNLASIEYQKNRHETALDFYIEAVSVDATDVSVWYKVGMLALKLDNHMLARFAFEQGLECSPRHWPCLDNVIPVLYALNNYEVCLIYLAKALFRDPGYVKGKAFLHKIFTEQPSLKEDSEELFRSCDIGIYTKDAETQKGDKFVKEALSMRETRRELSKVPPIPQVTFTQPLRSFSWKAIGGALVTLYEHIAQIKKAQQRGNSDYNRVSFGCKVDLSAYQSSSIAQSVALAAEMAPILPTLAPQDPIPDPEAPAVDQEPPLLLPVSQTDDMPMDTQTDTHTDTQTDSQTEGHPDPQTELSQDMIPHNSGEDGSLSDHNMDSAPNPFTSPVHHGYASMTPPHTHGSKRGRKRKFHPLGEDFSGKRRSARVRNTVTKKDEVVDFHELFAKFLPMSMLEVQEFEGEEDTSVPETVDAAANQPTKPEDYLGNQPIIQSLSSSEVKDVQDFLRSCHSNSGVIDLLNRYLIVLANKAYTQWPEGLAEIYKSAYQCLRPHFEYPDYLCKDVPDVRIHDMALMCLVYMELQLDQWLARKSDVMPHDASPHRSPGGVYPTIQHALGSDFPGNHFEPDLAYMNGLSVFQDVMGVDWQAYCARVYWSQARFLLLKSDMEWAIDCFCRTEEYLTYDKEEGDDQSPLVVSLPNCKHDNVIDIVHIQKQLDMLKRCQSLEAIQRLHECGSYEKVIELLLQTFIPVEMPEIHSRERHTQLLLLQDSLLQVQDYKRCVTWSEVSLHEAMKKYFSATSMVKQEWLATLCQLMEGINTCFSASTRAYLSISSKTIVRLTHNLTRVIQKAMDTPSSAFQMAIPTMLPWMLLYRLIKNEEKRQGPMVTRMDENVLPCSLILLNIGHEYLGRRGWCVRCDGHLLLFTIDMLMDELSGAMSNSQHPYKEDVEMALEQAFYCLYAHPNKRTKAKHLDDHNIEPIQLTWERAIPLFEYFKPKSVPEYDSYRASTVSAEQENLLRKISLVAPQPENPVNTIESVTAYIEGATSQPPSCPEGIQRNMPVISELYYLLGDYYFKNKEQMKAIKFYMLDLCTNPCRFDSWAGMALARASRLEQKLSSHEFRPEVSIQRLAICTLRCFKRALQLEAANSKLWIEYGSIAYQLHSFASRQLKQKHWHPFTADQLELAKTNKGEMLKLAEMSYKKVADGDGDEMEEQWLSHYMLGKVAEKMEAPPKVYLEHYRLAASFLHEDRAKYPKKITFYHSAPHLALESLEMFYRIHVSILKYLLRHSDDPDLPLEMFDQYVSSAANGPFANCQELKTSERKLSDRLDGNSQDEFSSQGFPTVATVATETKKTSTHKAIPDHTYSMEKLTSESSEQSSQESDYRDSSSVFSSARTGGHEPRREPGSPASSIGSPLPVHARALLSSSKSPIPALKPPAVPTGKVSPLIDAPPPPAIPSEKVSSMIEAPTCELTASSREKGLSTVDAPLPPGASSEKLSSRIDAPTFMLPGSSHEKVSPRIDAPMELDSAATSKPSLVSNKAGSPGVPETTSSIRISQVAPPSEPADEITPMEICTPDPPNTDPRDGDSTKTDPATITPSLDVSGLDFETPAAHNVPCDPVAVVARSPVMSVASRVEADTTEPAKDPEHFARSSSRRISSSFSMDSILGTISSSSGTTKEENTDAESAVALVSSAQSQSIDQEFWGYLGNPPQTSGVSTSAKPAAERGTDCTSTVIDVGSDCTSGGRAKGSPSDPCVTSASVRQTINEGVADDDVPMKESRPSGSGTEEFQVLNVDGTDDRTTQPEAGSSSKPSQQGGGHSQSQGHANSQTEGTREQNPNATCSVKEVKVEETVLDPSAMDFKEEVKSELESSHDVILQEKPQTDSSATKPSASTAAEENPAQPSQSLVLTEKTLQKSPLPSSTDNVDTETRVKEAAKGDTKPPPKDNGGTGKSKNQDARYRKVLDGCMKALRLCLVRLPQHHKSLYNLAYAYMNCPQLRNLECAQDLLLGHNKWAELSYMPCPGMFHERKQNNFFQGLWKIPIEEIDRSGSFAAHLTASLELLFEVLEARKQSRVLYNIHLQLYRTPDAGKKYVRDSDRIFLAEKAFEICVKVLEVKVAKAPAVATVTEKDPGLAVLMEVYKVWQYGLKQKMDVQRVNKLLTTAFRGAKVGKPGDNATDLEQAIKYCQHQQQIQMAAKPSQSMRPDDTEAYSRKPTSESVRGSSTGAELGKTQPKTPEALARARAAEKLRQELLARAKRVSRSPQKSPGKVTSPGHSATQEELLAQYQQQQSQQMDMMTALAQLYQHSGYSMAYAASLQAMSQSLYEGYSGFGSPSTSAALEANAATSMMQSAALAAATGMYPYGGYPMLNTDTLAALSAASSGSTSLLSPGSLAKSLTSMQKSPPSKPHGTVSSPGQSTKQQHQGTSKGSVSPVASKPTGQASGQGRGSSQPSKPTGYISGQVKGSSEPSKRTGHISGQVKSSQPSKSTGQISGQVKSSQLSKPTGHISGQVKGSQPSKPTGQMSSQVKGSQQSKPTGQMSGQVKVSPVTSKPTGQISGQVRVSDIPRSMNVVPGTPPNQAQRQTMTKMPSPSTPSRSPGHGSAPRNQSSQQPSGTTHSAHAKSSLNSDDVRRQIVPGVNTMTPAYSRSGVTTSTKPQAPSSSFTRPTAKSNVSAALTSSKISSPSQKMPSYGSSSSPHIPKPSPHLSKPSPHVTKASPFMPNPLPHHQKVSPHLSKQRTKASPHMQRSSQPTKASPQFQKAYADLKKLATATSTKHASPQAPSTPQHREIPASPVQASKLPAWGSPRDSSGGSQTTTPSRQSAISISPSKDSVLSLSSESLDVVIISSSQESDDDE